MPLHHVATDIIHEPERARAGAVHLERHVWLAREDRSKSARSRSYGRSVGRIGNCPRHEGEAERCRLSSLWRWTEEIRIAGASRGEHPAFSERG